MLKNKIGPLVLVIGIASWACACSSSNTGAGTPATGGTGGALATGGAGGTGGTSATGGTGGALATGGTTAAGGSTSTGGAGGAPSDAGISGAGGSTMTLAEACTKNCVLGHSTVGSDGGVDCSTTMDVCVQNCEAVFTKTSAVNPSLGTLYTRMMVCIATNPYFSTASGFICAKPNRAMNKWSPDGPPDTASDCETDICLWNCGDPADSDPFIDLRCTCSSV
jgi:hypothetical protein